MLPEKGIGKKVFIKVKRLHVLALLIFLLTIIVSAFGVFYSTESNPFDFINQYGDKVKIYGKGLYEHDSYFRAPIFRGTDFTMLFVACPLLTFSLVFDIKKNDLKARLLLVSVLTCFVYYAASIAFGVTYNFLQLFYISLFGVSVFALIEGVRSISSAELEKCIQKPLPYKGIFVFMAITGIALFAAWLPDIIASVSAHRSLLRIENYTTEITYVLDMGIIAPTCFICLYLLKKKKALGYILLDMLLTLCIIIGVMLPVQTMFQMQANIELTAGELIGKMGSFCLLALFALYFKTKFWNAVVE